MCGFAGFLSTNPGSHVELDVLAVRMANTIAHRGPNDSGIWTDSQAGIALGHRRLSIIDLSPAGHQPMASSCGRFVIVFNGEIYNHLDLRAELQAVGGAPDWLGHSDTETLLAAFEHWGVQATLSKVLGMFAFALWEVQKKMLYLARDRFGEKPLYYGWAGSGSGRAFVFGSELKALCAFPGFANAVCRQALVQYMRFMYVPAPRSIYRDIYKLEPGCVLSISNLPPLQAPQQPLRPPIAYESLSLSRWWSLADVVEAGTKKQIIDEVEAVNELEKRISDAVRSQLLADVPLGAFLSGGVDSSAIVALMQRQAGRPVKTFTVGFEEAGFDESPHARAVAKHLGTDHTELFVTAAQAQAIIPQLSSMYDEPFSDSSQIPTHLVCFAARQKVTVALSGDAGDELFGGYNRYFWGPRIWKRWSWLPYPMREVLCAAAVGIPLQVWDGASRSMNVLLPNSRGITRAGEKVHKLAICLKGARNLDDLYHNLISEWQDPAKLVRGDNGEVIVEPSSLLADPLPAFGVEQDQLKMMYLDGMTYLTDDILCKIDRAAMAVGFETRVPFLDHRVVELAWQLPLNMKIRGAQGKWALRQVLYRHVPRELIERPKAGFSMPVGQWLRGPLRLWAEALLDEEMLQKQGYFYPAPIRKKWIEHLEGWRDHTHSLWAVLMFQSWLDRSH